MKKSILTILSICFFAFYGNAQFTSNPDENTRLSDLTGEQAIPKIAICTDGSMYVSWFSNENSNYNVRMQYLDVNGNPQWENNGLLISDEPQMTWLTDYDLTTDPANYAIVTFQDIRETDNNPVAYRVSPTGEMAWGESGIMLSNNSNFEPAPKVCATEAGNIIFAWQSAGDANEVHMQKVSPAGDLLWGDGIALSEAGVEYTAPYLQPADGDFAFLIWHKETGPFWAPNRGLYVQKLNTDGSFMWTQALEIFAPLAAGAVVSLEMCRDNDGGIIFSKYGNDVGTHFNCWVQHMSAEGILSMPANTFVSTSQTQLHMYPAPSFLPETEEIIVFFSEQDLNQNQRGLYAQKFDLQGNRHWTDNGKVLIPLSYNDYSLPDANGYMDKAICVYGAFEFGNSADEKVQAVMLDTDGNYVWNDQFIDMSTVQSAKLHRVMTPINGGQWVAVWGDERNGNRDIYAQNIRPDGSMGAGALANGKLQGFVRDAGTNLAIDAATITVSSTDDSYQTSETPFGSHYSIMVPEGTYNISCEATGYQTAEANGIVVDPDQNTQYSFYLMPVDNITSTQNVVSDMPGVYPNPFTNTLNIEVSGLQDQLLNIEIKDVQGRTVMETSSLENAGQTEIRFDVSSLNPGFYSYSIITNKSRYSGKIIKN
ncbi:MAG: T9SS type A sorting domain-containing protein [Bacteroidales bacterium]|nr:T9SS type A sorting domain-containing protein [Bacteroidales bacterium]